MSKLFDSIGVGFGILFIVMLIAIVFLIIISGTMMLEINRMRRSNRSMKRSTGKGRGSSGKKEKASENEMKDRLEQLESQSYKGELQGTDIRDIKSKIGTTLTRYGIVKYDAFDDVGGKLSFVLAMLDENNTGFVLDAIHSRDNCFLYLKEIVNGESYIMLSNEEMDALRKAAFVSDEEEII